MSDDYYNVYESPTGKKRVVLKGGQTVCDFCLAPNPEWSYPCQEVDIIGHAVINRSDDDWGACDECHALIEADAMDKLVDRMVKWQKIHRPPSGAWGYPPEHLMWAFLHQNVLSFMKGRTGPAERELHIPPDLES
jgi:hypothetical protein